MGYREEKEGKKARRIFVDFDKIKDYEIDNILEYEQLTTISKDYQWSTQSSGIEIPENIAKQIEVCWKLV